MMIRSSKQHYARWLIMYMITALLFLTSIDLHIHTREAAASADHGLAVSISSFSAELSMAGNAGDEIKVSPDGVLKVSQGTINLLAVLLLIAIMVVCCCRSCIARLRDSHALLPVIPFHGTPPLRAPPVNS